MLFCGFLSANIVIEGMRIDVYLIGKVFDADAAKRQTAQCFTEYFLFVDIHCFYSCLFIEWWGDGFRINGKKKENLCPLRAHFPHEGKKYDWRAVRWNERAPCFTL